jgi:hypothetical protein
MFNKKNSEVLHAGGENRNQPTCVMLRALHICAPNHFPCKDAASFIRHILTFCLSHDTLTTGNWPAKMAKKRVGMLKGVEQWL